MKTHLRATTRALWCGRYHAGAAVVDSVGDCECLACLFAYRKAMQRRRDAAADQAVLARARADDLQRAQA